MRIKIHNVWYSDQEYPILLIFKNGDVEKAKVNYEWYNEDEIQEIEGNVTDWRVLPKNNNKYFTYPSIMKLKDALEYIKE